MWSASVGDLLEKKKEGELSHEEVLAMVRITLGAGGRY